MLREPHTGRPRSDVLVSETIPFDEQLLTHCAAPWYEGPRSTAPVLGEGGDPAAEQDRLEATFTDLTSRWTPIADYGDTAIGHFEGPTAPLDAEAEEQRRLYRKVAADVREVMRPG
jgi:hypothetical protein